MLRWLVLLQNSISSISFSLSLSLARHPSSHLGHSLLFKAFCGDSVRPTFTQWQAYFSAFVCLCVNLRAMKRSHSASEKKEQHCKKWLRRPWQHVQLSVASCESQKRSAANLDVLYARVPLVHLLHSDEQDVVQLLHAGLQDRFQPEDLPGPRQHFATDHVPVALSGRTTNRQIYIIIMVT